MAYAGTTSVAGTGLRTGGLLATIKTALQRRALYRQTLNELGALSCRELSDLGLTRATLRQAARTAAYGN